MSWPLALTALIVLGAGWMVARPAFAAATAGLGARGRGLAAAGVLAAVAAGLFAVRLAPFGVVALVLAGGTAARAMRRGPVPEDEGAPARVGMSEAEALSVLGLERGADAGAVDAAHRRMIARAHPDAGGSDYMAAKVNEARAVLRAGVAGRRRAG